MSCNNSVMVLYDVDETGIKLPSKYNENNLVSDMLKSLSEIKESTVIEVPIDVSIIETPAEIIEPTISTTSMNTTPSEITTTTAAEATTTTTTTTTTAASGVVEYFTNKISCYNKNNYLLFGIVITIILLIIVSILNKRT